MTQEDLAGEAELDRAFITMMEAGKKQPSVSVFWKLVNGVKLSAAELATRAEKRHGDFRAACISTRG
jgi:transcriptional regulator with XRE-family HTH domain